MRFGRRGAQRSRVVMDPTTCAGVAMCAHVAPDLIELDSWGYPMLPRQPLHGAELRAARAAVRACPRRALFIDRNEGTR